MEFIVKGKVTLDGVDFYIEAESLEAAQEIVRKGGMWSHYDTSVSSTTDWYYDGSSLEKNE